MRPPYGSWDKSFEKELNMFPVLWTVDPLDWCSKNVNCITEKIVSKTGENDIILMHDYYDTSVTAALKAIDELLVLIVLTIVYAFILTRTLPENSCEN